MPLTESLPSVVERLIAAANAQDTESFVGAFTPEIAQDIGGVKAKHKRASNPEPYTPAQRGLDMA